MVCCIEREWWPGVKTNCTKTQKLLVRRVAVTMMVGTVCNCEFQIAGPWKGSTKVDNPLENPNPWSL